MRDRTDDALVAHFAGDVRTAVEVFNLDAGNKRPTARSAMVLCPWHSERSPSCHLSLSGELVAHCHGCGRGGDVFDLAAAVFGLDFRPAKIRLASIIGIAVEPGAPVAPAAPRRPPPAPLPYPDAVEVAKLWGSCTRIVDDAAASAWCSSRRLDGYALEDRDLARALPRGAALPWWASYERQPWTLSGHRLLVPVYDAAGLMRSVRAIRIEGDEDSPKRLPPAGHRAAGLVLADPLARLVLAGEARASWPAKPRIIVCEGEPDFLTWASRFSDADEAAPAVLGVLSGAWTLDHAAKIPDGGHVLIDTDHDQAGDKYAAAVASSLEARCTVTRSKGAP